MPSAFRHTKNLSEWIDLGRYGTARRFLSGWSPWMLVAALVSLGLVMGALLLDKKTAFQSGPLSHSHGSFNNACAQCHTEPFAPAARLILSNSNFYSVSDASCVKCHNAGIHHLAEQFQPSCASCHKEHQGERDLKRVPDSECLQCHKDLQRADNAPPQVAQSITGFDAKSHPEMRIHQAIGGPSTDPGTVRFSHQSHLKPDGIFTIASFLPNGDANRVRKILRCADCHQTDKSGNLMTEISYDAHCKSCHPVPVRLAGTPSKNPRYTKFETLVANFQARPALHPARGQDTSATLGELRQRLEKLIGDPPQVQIMDYLDFQYVFFNGVFGARREMSDWSKAQMKFLAEQLFHPFGKDGKPSQAGCLYCHTADPKSADPIPLAKSNIPKRWNRHALFRHQSHQHLDCQSCHKAQFSQNTSDILMPTIKQCMDCHHTGSGGARADCSECHKYHPENGSRDIQSGPYSHTLEALTRGGNHGP